MTYLFFAFLAGAVAMYFGKPHVDKALDKFDEKF